MNTKQPDLHKLMEQVNIRIPADLNDWLNDAVTQTRRLHGSKIPKEMIIQTALEIFREGMSDQTWESFRDINDIHAYFNR